MHVYMNVNVIYVCLVICVHVHECVKQNTSQSKRSSLRGEAAVALTAERGQLVSERAVGEQ